MLEFKLWDAQKIPFMVEEDIVFLQPEETLAEGTFYADLKLKFFFYPEFFSHLGLDCLLFLYDKK